MRPNKGAKRSTLRGKRTRAIKKRRCGKGTRRRGKKIRGGLIWFNSNPNPNPNPNKLISAANELVNDPDTQKLFQNAIYNADLNTAIMNFINGCNILRKLMENVTKEATKANNHDDFNEVLNIIGNKENHEVPNHNMVLYFEALTKLDEQLFLNSNVPNAEFDEAYTQTENTFKTLIRILEPDNEKLTFYKRTVNGIMGNQ